MLDKLASVEAQYNYLMGLIADPAVQADAQAYRTHTKTLSDLQEMVDAYRSLKSLEEQLAQAREMVAGGDADMAALAREELADLDPQHAKLLEHVKFLLIPKDPNDAKNVVLEVRAGTGGEEAALFAAELFRMYARYAERQGWKFEVMSTSDADAGGMKEGIATIEGKQVYSHLRYESGVHRVQRVPATEASGRIHTSAITVAVLPEAEEVDVKIEAKDLRVDTFCSSGPGGQSVNTTYSAVRLTHLPTNTVVSCQDEKSQIKNREKAMKVLRARLYEVALAEQQKEIAKDRKSQVGSGDRSEKIRTYNYPQARLTDHRIGLTLHRLQDVLDGDLEEVVSALVAHNQAEKLHQPA